LAAFSGARRHLEFVPLVTICLPFFLTSFLDLVRKPKDLPWETHLKGAARNAAQQAGQAILTLTFVPYDACVSLDAILRTLGRLLFTHRHLLEWQTASEVEQQKDNGLRIFLQRCGVRRPWQSPRAWPFS
jgi:hypothetical protein